MSRFFLESFEAWFKECACNERYWIRVIDTIFDDQSLVLTTPRGRFSSVVRRIEDKSERFNTVLRQPLEHISVNLLSITGNLVEKNLIRQQHVDISFDWLRELFVMIYAFAYGEPGIVGEDICFLLVPLRSCQNSMTQREVFFFEIFLRRLEEL